jgi:hypothetical protein
MIDNEVQKIVDKLQRLRALRRARERVRQLELELNGSPARPEDPLSFPSSCARAYHFVRSDEAFRSHGVYGEPGDAESVTRDRSRPTVRPNRP